MDIDKIINSYQAHVKDAKPEDVAEKKDATLKKIENVSALAGLLGNIRTAAEAQMRATGAPVMDFPQENSVEEPAKSDHAGSVVLKK